MADDDLVRRAQSGDHAAFRLLVEEYGPLTERTARVLLAERSDAEDAVQEAWFDVWRGLRLFQLGRPFRPWLLTVVTNRCRIVARRRRPSVPYDDLLLDRLGAPVTVESYLFGTNTASFDALEAALAQLDEPHRRILALRFYADLQLDEIAHVVDVPLGTVKSRLHRALHALRVRLDGVYHAEDSRRCN